MGEKALTEREQTLFLELFRYTGDAIRSINGAIESLSEGNPRGAKNNLNHAMQEQNFIERITNELKKTFIKLDDLEFK